jgi:hypothetical protein
VVGVDPGPQVAEEVLDLVDRDGVADTAIHPPPLLERPAAVDPDQLAGEVEERTAGVAGIDRRVDLDAVGILERPPPLRRLVAVHPADEPEGHGRSEVERQPERVAHGQRPVADPHPVAVPERNERELVPLLLRQELDQGNVADLVESDDDGVVKLPVRKTALQHRPGRLHDVEVGEGVAIRVDEDAGPARLPAPETDRDHGRADPGDDRHPLGLGVEDGLLRFDRRSGPDRAQDRREARTDQCQKCRDGTMGHGLSVRGENHFWNRASARLSSPPANRPSASTEIRTSFASLTFRVMSFGLSFLLRTSL